jgi:hypothetical protein
MMQSTSALAANKHRITKRPAHNQQTTLLLSPALNTTATSPAQKSFPCWLKDTKVQALAWLCWPLLAQQHSPLEASATAAASTPPVAARFAAARLALSRCACTSHSTCCGHRRFSSDHVWGDTAKRLAAPDRPSGAKRPCAQAIPTANKTARQCMQSVSRLPLSDGSGARGWLEYQGGKTSACQL